MADGEYKISLGVDVDTSGIQEQINSDVRSKIKPIKIDIDLNHTNKQIDTIKSQIQSLNKIKVNLGAGSGKNGIKGSVNDMNWAYRQMLDIQKKANSLSLKINGLDTSKNVNELKELSLQFSRLRSDYDTLKRTFGGQLSTAQWGNLQAEVDETSAKLAAMDAKLADTKSNLANGIKLKLADGTFKNDISNIESKFNKLSNQTEGLQSGIDGVKRALTDMSNAAKTGNVEKLISANENYEQSLKNVYNQLQINARIEKDAALAQKLDDNRNAFMSNIDAWLTKNSAATKKFGAQMLELKAQAKSCDQVTLNHLRTEFKRLDKEAEAAGLKMQTFGDRLKSQFSRYSQYFSVASLMIYATQGLKDMFNQVVAIDSAMTELKKVTDETDASYNKFLTNAASRSKEIGTTIDGLVQSTADFARLGYEFKDATGLAEVANIYAVVGDEIEGVEQATESLISTMAAFKDEAVNVSNTDFAMGIVDKFNEIGNKFAISSGGIGESLKRSASSLDAANNTIDESIALITAANTVVQNPDKVGNAFKTISMRIRGAKTELEEAGESTDGMVESTATLRQEIMALSGVDIMLNKNTFKSTYQVMDELASKWEDLSDIAQASIIELMAGKHQGNVFSSLMSNFDIAREALEVSANSAGSAMTEHAKWSQSLEARLLKLKAAWQSLSQSFMGSDFLKGALDGIIGLVDGVNKLIDTFGTLPTLLTGLSMFRSAFSNKGIFKTFNNDLDGFTNKVGIASKSFAELANAFNSANTGGIKGFFNGLKSIGDSLINPLSKMDLSAIDAYNKLIDDGIDGQIAFAKTMSNTSNAAQDLVKSADGGKVAINGIKTASMGGKAALLGMRAAALLMNAALTLGISLLIDFAVSGIQKLINRNKELAESVDEITSKFKEQHEEIAKLRGDYDTSNESSMISKYKKLSNGVDNLGRNISLTAEEYSEYQSIVNKISEQFPSLISGYDEQGNALLNCKGNVDSLTEAYEKLIHAQNQSILANTGDIEKDFANKLKNMGGDHWWSDGHGFWAGLLNGAIADPFIGIFSENYDLKNDTVKRLENVLGANKSERDKIYNEIKNDAYSREELRTALERSGIEMGYFDDPTKVLEETLKTDPSKVKGIIDNYYAQFADAVEKQKTIAQAKLSEAFDVSSAISGLNYGNISEELQTVAYQVINSFDYDFLSKLSESGKSVEQWVTEMLNQLNAIGEADNAKIEAAFDLQAKFNGGEVAYGEYVRNLTNVKSTIDGLNLKGEAKEQLEITLGLNEDGVIDQYNALVNRLTDPKNYDFDISEDEAKRFLDGLSSEELSIAVDVITEMSNNNVDETIDQIRTAVDRELSIRGLSLELSVDVEKTKLESLTTALTESFSGSGLSSDSLKAVEDMFKGLNSYDPSKLFERTANGIRLNSDEFRRLNSEYEKTNIAKVNKELDSLGDIYNQTRQELYGLTYGTDEYNAKASELSSIESQIKATEQLAAQYKGLTSAYQEWQMAESAGSQRDMYENIISGFENIDDEIKRGWYDDGTIEFLELLTGKDLSTAGIDKVKKAYKGLNKTIKNTSYSVRDFFTVDDDGNSTNTGVYNFLDAIGQMEEEKFGGKDVVKRDKKGNIIGFNFKLVGGDEVIADALGVSKELVQIMVRAADDAGFVISMDGTYQQLDVLKEKAQLAAESLNKALEKSGKKGFDFNFNTSDVKDIKKQLTEAQKILDTFRNTDGTINTKLEGADEALTVASTLQSMLDKLTRPTYMNIQANQVDDELQEPLRHLQELTRLTETEHQLKLSGADTSKLEESKQEVYEYFEKLDPEIKATLGLVDKDGNPLTGQALKDKLNSGDIAIEATIDIQLEMDEKLGILVDKALLDAGIIDDEEFKKRVNIYLDADVDNEDAKNKTEQAVNEVDKNTESEVKTVKTKTKAEVEKTKAEVKTEIDNTKAEVKSQVDSVKSDAKSKVESVKSDVENLKVEIANMEAGVESLSQSLKTLQEIKDDISVSVDANLDGNVPYLDEAEHIDDLLIFAEGAKSLQDLSKDINVSVTANLGGNVPYLDESAEIDDLLMFSAGTEALKDLPKETNVSVTANLYGNVHDMNESEQIDDLLMFAAGTEALQGLENVDLSVDVSLSKDTKDILSRNEDSFTQDLQTLAKGVSDLQNLTDEDVDIDVDISLSESTNKILKKNEGSFTQDLQTLATGINDLQGLNGVDIDIDVSLSEDTQTILGKNENSFTQDLQTLATGVSDLQDLKSVDLSIGVSFDGDTKEILSKNENAYIQDLQTLATGIDDLQNLQNVDASVNISLSEDTKDILAKNENSFIQDLQTLATGIDDLQGLTDVNAEVNVSLSEDTKEILKKNENSFTQDLQTLAAGIDDLQGLQGVDIDVDVALSDNTKEILKKNEGSFTQDLQTLATGINKLQNLENVDLSVDVSLSSDTKDILNKNEDNFTQDLQTLATGVKSLQNLQSVDADVDISLSDATKDILEKNENSFIQDLQTLATGVKSLQGVADVDASVNVSVDGNAIIGDDAFTRRSALTEVKSLINGMSNQDVTISVKANVDSENVNKAIQLLKDIQNSGLFKDYNATVKVGATIAKIDDAKVQEYKVPPKEGKVSYSVDPLSKVYTWAAPSKDGVVNYSAEVEALTSAQKNKTGTITYKANIVGLGPAAGTAHASGSTGRAFARGDWGIKGNGVALGGELGQELVVRDGKFFTIGDAGAEFFRYKKNDIVFNAAQTESLFKYGGIKGANPRGKILASGTAFAEGNAFAGSSGTGGAGKVKGTPVGAKKNNKKKTNSNSNANDFEETFDWIEIAISRVERAIDKLDQKANNVYKSWSSRNGALTSEISKVREEIELQEDAAQKYLDKANSVGLSSSWKKKVQNGKVDISTIKDEGLAEKIKDYQTWYEKYLDCIDAAEKLKETEAALYKQKFDNIETRYDGILGVIEHEKNILDEYIAQSEAKGRITSAEYYKALIDNENNNISKLEAERNELIKARDEAVASGAIKVGSEAWYDFTNRIDGVTLSIEKARTATIEYNNSIRDIEWQVFDLLQDKISKVAEESDFLIDLLSNEKLYDDNGKLTDEGNAVMGLHGQNYNTYMAQADKYAKEISELDKEIAKDPYNQDLINRRQELVEAQRDSILAAEEEKQAIVDMVEEGINLELDALQERIDKYNESIEAQKDLYDYQKKVKEQTEEIASLEKQIAAYRGNDSEEARAKVQELEMSLEEAKENLQETEYEKYISDQQKLLDELYLEYETILNTRLDNVDALISDAITQINANASSISTTISEKADSVGYNLSDSMKTIWSDNAGSINGVITTYGDKFSTAQTTTNNALNIINTNLQSMIMQLNKIAKTNVKSASTSSSANTTESKKTDKKTETTKKDTTKKQTTSTIKVGGKINAKGAKIYDFAGDTSGERQLYRNDPIYTVLSEKNGYLKVRYHKLSSGVTGWFKKSDVKAYASGKKNILNDEIAWTQEGRKQEFIVRPSDGAILTPIAKGDSVLNAVASGNIWNMANNPSDFIKDNLGLDASNIPNVSSVQSNYTQHLDKVVFNLPNVKNYDELLAQMQKDKSFEKLIMAMTVDRIVGKSSLAKGKSIR